MKIFYAVQATGNGHIARAKELLPYLRKFGSVDVFLSGGNSSLQPTFDVKYRSKGLSFFYNKNGGLDYKKTVKCLQIPRVLKEARSLPLEKYDVILNDFECITSIAAKLKRIPTVAFGHQSSFLSSNTPRPDNKDLLGEFVLRNYASGRENVGLHFRRYADFIYPAVIKDTVKNAIPKDFGHFTVYLPHYSDKHLFQQLKQCGKLKFEVFSPFVTQKFEEGNITFFPIDNTVFTRSLINSRGVITGGGFETPAEALYLRKKLFCIPIHGQYEQYCNIAALKEFGVTVSDTISENFAGQILQWEANPLPMYASLEAMNNTELVDIVMQKAINLAHKKRGKIPFFDHTGEYILQYPDLELNLLGR